MKVSDSYKGFPYQKRCALYHFFWEYFGDRPLRFLRMEHAEGDDFDLIFAGDEWEVFQVKNVEGANLPENLQDLWRRYTENMKPNADRDVSLFMVFSKEQSHPCFAALHEGRLDDNSLAGIVARVNASHLTQRKIKGTDEWQAFLEKISPKVFSEEKLEDGLRRMLKMIFEQNQIPEEQIDAVRDQFLGYLDGVMTLHRAVPVNEIKELMRRWFADFVHRHAAARDS